VGEVGKAQGVGVVEGGEAVSVSSVGNVSSVSECIEKVSKIFETFPRIEDIACFKTTTPPPPVKPLSIITRIPCYLPILARDNSN
jgi:hypothetical protein